MNYIEQFERELKEQWVLFNQLKKKGNKDWQQLFASNRRLSAVVEVVKKQLEEPPSTPTTDGDMVEFPEVLRN